MNNLFLIYVMSNIVDDCNEVKQDLVYKATVKVSKLL
jgi:hypothetical protein